jgi:hypothetical protein
VLVHTVGELLKFAIDNKQVINVRYHGEPRVVEPHDYGIHNGKEKVLVYQLREAPSVGKSTTRWRMLEVSKIEECVVTDTTFRGSRGADHTRHFTWDKLYARVT